MARHSSFKNLLALETRRNFSLIARLSTGPLSNESESAPLRAIADGPAESEGAIHGGLPQEKIEGTIANSVETVSTPRFEE